MTYFYECDEKWTSRLREMGVTNPPASGNAALWPEAMKCDVISARKKWNKSFHSIADWENIVKPLYAKWLGYHRARTSNDSEAFARTLLETFQPKCKADANHLYDKIIDFLLGLANDMKCENKKLDFTPELSGSVSQGTKLGPMDEWDFRMVLDKDLSPKDPVLKALYTSMWKCLSRLMTSQDNTAELVLIGFIINSARLPSLVFTWSPTENTHVSLETPKYIKIDLAPIIPNAPIDREVKKELKDPLTGDCIHKLNYLLLYGSDKSRPVEEYPKCKLSSCGVEQNVLNSVPPVLRKAMVLLKIVTGPTTIPHFACDLSKSCKFTSYNIKDCLFWALSEGKLDKYLHTLDGEDSMNNIVSVALILLNSVHTSEYFSTSQKNDKLVNPFLRLMHHYILVRGYCQEHVVANSTEQALSAPCMDIIHTLLHENNDYKSQVNEQCSQTKDQRSQVVNLFQLYICELEKQNIPLVNFDAVPKGVWIMKLCTLCASDKQAIDMMDVNFNNAIISISSKRLCKLHFSKGIYEQVWERVNSLYDNNRDTTVFLLSDSSTILHSEARTSSEKSLTRIFDPEFNLLCEYKGDYGRLLAACQDKVVYIKWQYGKLTLQMYNAADHQYVKEMVPPYGKEWHYDTTMCIHHTGWIGIYDWNTLYIYNPNGDHVRHCEVEYYSCLSCSDDFLVGASWTDSIHVHRWNLEHVVTFSRQELQLTESEHVKGAWCGEGDVIHVRTRIGSKTQLVAYKWAGKRELSLRNDSD